MTSRIGKRTTAILAFIALALSVIVPLSVPKAFSAPNCHRAEVGDYQAKIDKVVTDLAAKVKEKGEYVYSGQHFPELNSISPGFGMYREITKVIKGNGYTFEDIFGQGAKFKAVSLGSGGGLETPKVEIHLTSPTKTFDEAKFKDAVSKELTKFLKEHPREICEPGTDEPIVEPTKPSEPTTKPTGDNPKPGCHKAGAKDYAASIKKVVDKIEASKHQKEVTGKVESEHGAKSFLTVFYVYEWNTAILRQINPGITDRFVLTEEQTKQVFGDGAKIEMTAVGPAPAMDENGNGYSVGEGSETFHAENATKFDREAMTKIITDKVSEFLAKNPQEICEGGSDTEPGDTPEPGTNEPTVEPTTPGNDTKPGDTTEPGNTTEPGKDEPTVEPTKPGTTDPTTEPTKPGDDSKPGDATEPGDTPKPGTTEPTTPGNDNKPGNDTKPGGTKPGSDTKSGTDTKPGNDTKPGETSKDSKTPAPKANNGSQNAPEGTDTNGDSQTVLEGATEAGGLATTGAVGLIALGVSVLLVGAGVGLAVYRRKTASKNV